jgi:hypothetical protein
MRTRLYIAGLCIQFLLGCAGTKRAQVVFYDIEGINYSPGGVSAALERPSAEGGGKLVAIIGNFGESSIEIASHNRLDSPLIVGWRTKDLKDHERQFPFHILPPLDTANQKYHIRFTFYPNDSVRVQARAVAKSDCRHTIRHGATALAAFGPCVSDRGWSNTLDSVAKGLILRPQPGPLDFPDP